MHDGRQIILSCRSVRMARLYRCGAALTGLFILCYGANAAETGPGGNPLPRDAYRQGDEKGRGTYSELPPAGGGKKVDITPASSGHPGATTRTRSDSASRAASLATRRGQTAESQPASADPREAGRQKELAEVQRKNKCERYGGDGCPDTLTQNPDPAQPLWRLAPPPERVFPTWSR